MSCTLKVVSCSDWYHPLRSPLICVTVLHICCSTSPLAHFPTLEMFKTTTAPRQCGSLSQTMSTGPPHHCRSRSHGPGPGTEEPGRAPPCPGCCTASRGRGT
eukprot:364943-Chlamydomonas_euryale.AAC.16